MEEEKIYQDIRKDFESKLEKNVMPAISAFEQERKLTHKKAKGYTIVWTLFTLFAFVFFNIIWFFASKESNHALNSGELVVFTFVYVFLFIITGPGGIAVSYSIYFEYKKKFENKIKNTIMPIVCECFSKLKWANYRFKTYYEKYYIFVYRFIYRFFQYSSKELFALHGADEYFIGEYNSVQFSIIEEPKRCIYICINNMNKNFKGTTVMKPHSKISKLLVLPRLHKTVLEDVEFEKKFEVYTDDDVEARYLITPSFMERLNNIKVAFKTKKVFAVFCQDKLFIELYTNKDLFSICTLSEPLNDKKQFYTMFEEILSIYKLIDYFKLDQKIGL